MENRAAHPHQEFPPGENFSRKRMHTAGTGRIKKNVCLEEKKHEHNLHAKQKHAGRNKIAITCYDWLIPRLLSSGAIHSTKMSGNFGPKLNGSVRSNRKSFEKTGPPFEVVLFSRSDRSEFWLNGSRPSFVNGHKGAY